MTRPRYLIICITCCCLLLVPIVSAQTLQIINAEGHATTLTAAQIASAAHVGVDVRDHDSPARFEGVPVSTLLSLAGIQLATPYADHAWPKYFWSRHRTDTKWLLRSPSWTLHSPCARSWSQINATANRWI